MTSNQSGTTFGHLSDKTLRLDLEAFQGISCFGVVFDRYDCAQSAKKTERQGVKQSTEISIHRKWLHCLRIGNTSWVVSRTKQYCIDLFSVWNMAWRCNCISCTRPGPGSGWRFQSWKASYSCNQHRGYLSHTSVQHTRGGRYADPTSCCGCLHPVQYCHGLVSWHRCCHIKHPLCKKDWVVNYGSQLE